MLLLNSGRHKQLQTLRALHEQSKYASQYLTQQSDNMPLLAIKQTGHTIMGKGTEGTTVKVGAMALEMDAVDPDGVRGLSGWTPGSPGVNDGGVTAQQGSQSAPVDNETHSLKAISADDVNNSLTVSMQSSGMDLSSKFKRATSFTFNRSSPRHASNNASDELREWDAADKTSAALAVSPPVPSLSNACYRVWSAPPATAKPDLTHGSGTSTPRLASDAGADVHDCADVTAQRAGGTSKPDAGQRQRQDSKRRVRSAAIGHQAGFDESMQTSLELPKSTLWNHDDAMNGGDAGTATTAHADRDMLSARTGRFSPIGSRCTRYVLYCSACAFACAGAFDLLQKPTATWMCCLTEHVTAKQVAQ